MKTIILPLLTAGIFATAAPAQADTRNDVLSRIQRCSVIQDDRTWLDCLYGAEQPMRAHLGLPPAPQFQQRLVPQASAAAPGATIPTVASGLAPSTRNKAGFFGILFGSARPVAVSRMTAYHFDKRGAFIVELENGQEWRQTDVSAGTVSWTKPPSAYLVTVTQGAFGSYNLHTDDNPYIYKVQPIR